MIYLQKSVEVVDRNAWKETTEILWDYLRRDHSDTLNQLQYLYPKTWDQRVLRIVPFVHRIARELAGLYRKSPTRTHLGVSEEMQTRINSLYKGARADIKLQTLQEHLVVLNNACMFVWPMPKIGGIRLIVVPPHEVEVITDDILSDDVRDIEKVHIRLPVGYDETTGIIAMGIAEITPTTAIWKEAPGKMRGKGLWYESGVNPLGRVPMICLRGTDPQPGTWWASPNEDLLTAQRALSLGFTDLGYIASTQGFGQPIIRGMSRAHAEEIELGPETIIGLPDPDQDFLYRHGSPPLSEYQVNTENYLSVLLAHLGLSPGSFLKTGAVTAVAKAMDMIDRDVERQRHITMFDQAEQDLWKYMREWVQILRGGNQVIYPEAKVEIDYHELERPVDPLHDSQAIRMAIEDGRTTAAQEMAKSKGISVTEAQRVVQANLEETARLKSILEADQRVAQGRETSSELELAINA